MFTTQPNIDIPAILSKLQMQQQQQQQQQPMQNMGNTIGMLKELASLSQRKEREMPAPYDYSSVLEHGRQDFLMREAQERKNLEKQEQRAFQEAEKQKEKEAYKKGLAAVLSAKKDSGKSLGFNQILGIMSEHVSPQMAKGTAVSIVNAQEAAKPKEYAATWVDSETGETISGIKTKKEMGAGLVSKKLTPIEKIYRKLDGGASYDSLTKWEKAIFMGQLSKGKAKKPEEARTWAQLKPAAKSKYITEYEENDPGVHQSRGWHNVEDWAYGSKRFPKPKGYTFVDDLVAEMKESIERKMPDEEAITMALDARKAFGPVDTHNKWKKRVEEETEPEKVVKEVKKAPMYTVLPSGKASISKGGTLWNKETGRRLMISQPMILKIGALKRKNPKYLEYVKLLHQHGGMENVEYKEKVQEYNDLKFESIFDKRKARAVPMSPQSMVLKYGEHKRKNPRYLEYIELLHQRGDMEDAEYKEKMQEYNDLKVESMSDKELR